jgi:LuxR family maltose regulon positive regulatory protein
VSRPRLLKRLQDTGEASFVLVAAPAGYGKSTLLSQWARQEQRPLAWLTLGPSDDRPERLLRRVTSALEQLATLTAVGGPRAIDEQRRPMPADAGVLTATSEQLAPRGVLILDDIHHVRSPAAVRILSELAEASSEGLKLAMASRTEPTLGCGRLRASGRLLQIGPGELQMTVNEARRLLKAVGLNPDEADLTRLVDYTEGWAAALYLAATSLRGRPDSEANPAEMLRGDENIAEYIAEELLAPLPSASRSFLLRTSFLETLSADLCNGVLQTEGCGPILHEIADTSLMLQSQHPGHGWYRCHPLVRDVMRFELELTESEEMAPLHLRASSWFATAGDADAALDHAIAAHDPSRAGALLWAHGSGYGSDPMDERYTRWLGAFNDEQIAQNPQLALAAAYRRLACGELAQAEQLAQVAAIAVHYQRGREQSPALLASIALLRAAGASAGAEQMHSDATRAHRLLGESSRLRPLACLLQGVALELLGARRQARSALEEAVGHGAGVNAQLEALCLTELALQDVSDADWERAEDNIAHAAATLATHDLESHPTSAMTYAVSALLLGQRGCADEAKRDLVKATRLLDELGNYAPWHEVQARIVLARACVRLADVVRARALLAQASRWARRMEPVESLVAGLDACWGEVDDLSASAMSGPGSLTIAELRVLRFLPTHLSFREIGERLHVSGNTVKTQARAVYAKLDAASRTEAVAHAAALGLIEVTII